MQDDCIDNKLASMAMAKQLLLKQQLAQTALSPSGEANHVPASSAGRSDSPKADHPPRTTGFGQATTRHKEHAKLEFTTIGLEGEDIAYNEDFAVIAEQCKRVLDDADHLRRKIPIDRIFNCQDLIPTVVPPHYFKTCTGHNIHIFKSIWLSRDVLPIADEVLQSYKEHDSNCKGSEDYRAAFVCQTGDHRSVAVAMGLQTQFESPLCSVQHRNFENGKWKKRFCGGSCECCETWDNRFEEEMQIVSTALKAFRGLV